ncbi:MAG: hypothetical protein JNJ94_11480 [Chlorobi bacterium]|nr:hypothetical protein [Chlorobiota bacterium]
MPNYSINIAALQRRVKGALPEETSLGELIRGNGPAMSRRRVLAMGAGGAAAATWFIPSWRAVGGTLVGDFQIVGDERRVAFLLGGEERFVIEARRFAGKARIELKRESGIVHVRLADARWPGTTIPANMTITVRPGLLRRMLKIQMEFGGFSTEVPAEAWLMRATPARSGLRADDGGCQLGRLATLAFNGRALATFTPDWKLTIDGDSFAELTGLGPTLRSDQATLRLPDESEPNLITPPFLRRCHLTIERGGRSWPIEPNASNDPMWQTVAIGSPFDRLMIESAESGRGGTHHLLVAESPDNEERLQVRPAASIRGADLLPAALPLRGAHYAVAFGEREEATALVARFGSPRWIHTDGGSALVGDSPRARFALQTRGGKIEQVECVPALLAAMTQPAETGRSIVEPAPLPPTALFRIASHLGGQANDDGVMGAFRLDPQAPDTPPEVTLAAPTWFVRPEDLLVVGVQLHNLSVQGGKLVRTGGGVAHIILVFPPQNIGEQAFFETDPNLPNSESAENPPPPPVFARIADPSRISFTVPASMNNIDFTLEKILDLARRLNMNLPPAGRPLGDPGTLHFSGGGFLQLPNDALKGLKMGVGAKSAAVTKISKAIKKGVTNRIGGGGGGGIVMDDNSSTAVTDDENPALQRYGTARFRRTSVWHEAIRNSEAGAGWASAADAGVLGVGVVESEYSGIEIIPELRQPTNIETAIECPFRLIISPNKNAAWAHSTTPVAGERTGRFELWHTRLAVRGHDGIRDDGNAPNEVEEEASNALKGMKKVGAAAYTASEVDFVYEGASWMRTIRAVWSRDEHFLQYQTPGSGGMDPFWIEETDFSTNTFRSRPKHANDPFRMSLDAVDRFDVVQLSANFKMHNYKPRPVNVDRIMLSALGAWMNVRGNWEPPGLPCDLTDEQKKQFEGEQADKADDIPPAPQLLAVEEWRHRAVMGRDNYVRVVYKGYLFPFGHRASLIKVTERKFHKNKPGNPAYLRQHMYIIVREPEKSYLGTNITIPANGNTPLKQLDLEMPIMRLKLTTLVTPNIEDPKDSDIDGEGEKLFWVRVNGADLLWQFEAEDFEGHIFNFTAPLIFVENGLKIVPAKLKKAVTNYDLGKQDGGFTDAARPSRALEGSQVTFAPTGSKAGDTTFQTAELTFSAEVLALDDRAKLGNCDAPLFYPIVKKARIVIPAIRTIAGNKDPGQFEYHPIFLQHGMPALNDKGLPANSSHKNKGEVLFRTAEPANKMKVSFQTQGDKAGSLVKPNMAIAGLARKLGPVSGDVSILEDIANANFKPESFFGGGSVPVPDLDDILPLIFGCIPLSAILEAVGDFADELGLDAVPKFINEAMNTLESMLAKFQNMANEAQKFADQAMGFASNAKSKAEQTVNGMVNQVNGVLNAASVAAGQVMDIINAINTALDYLANNIYSVLEDIAELDTASVATTITTFKGHVNAVQDAFNAVSNLPSQAVGVRNQVVGFLTDITAALDCVLELNAIVAAAKKVVNDVIGSDDPADASDPNKEGIVAFFESLADLDESAITSKLTDFKTDLDALRNAFSAATHLPEELSGVRSAVVGFLQDVSNVLAEVLDKIDEFFMALDMLREQKVRFGWHPPLQDWGFESGHPIFIAKDGNKKADLFIGVEAGMHGGEGDSPYFQVECTLKDFTVDLIAPLSFIALHFEKIQFLAGSSVGADVNVKLRELEFIGPLSFIETLKDAIPLDGFSDPPAIDVSEKGIIASFSIPIPSIVCGVLNLSNISIGAGFTIPFIGDPLSVSFFFCTRDNPFMLTVYIFGGGGFFGITLNPKGIHLFEVAFEFGAGFSIDFGVAGGEVKVVAGIYFKMTTSTDPESCVITGYLHLTGRVYVAFVGASIELKLELTYESVSGKCTGRASIIVEIDVPLVPSIEIEYEEKFAGSNGDPSFLQMFEPFTLPSGKTVDPWAEYCEAFAAE